MSKTINVTECAKLLRANDDYLLVTHCRPDGDTLGSAGALCLALRSIGKTAYLINNPEVTDKYNQFISDLVAPDGYAAKTFVSVDVASESMFPKGFEGKELLLAIDHHGSNTFFAENVLLEPHYAACGELVLEVAEAIESKIDSRIADLLYIAISTDTGCFQYKNTTANTHRAVAKTFDYGADYGRLNKILFRTLSKARMKLEGLMYEGLRHYKDGQINIAVVTLDMLEKSQATENDCDDLAAIAGRVEGSKCSVTIKEISKDSCKVSVRTGGEVNANEVCAQFGGGGHPMAAGCRIDCSAEEAREKLVAVIMGAWK